MKQLFHLLSLVLLASVSLTSCRIPGWDEEELMPQQEEASQDATRKPSDNIIYLHKYSKEHNLSPQAAFTTITQKGIVVVDFYADWCRPCTRLGDTLQSLSNELSSITILKINVDLVKELSSSIRSIPVVAFYKNGKEAKRVVGLKSKKELRDIISSL